MKNKTANPQITILGAGSWGIAVAVHLNDCGHRIRLWEFDAEDAKKLASAREHKAKLPGIKIPDRVAITNDLAGAMNYTDIIALAVPSHTMRVVARSLGQYVDSSQIIVNLAKGLERESLMRMSEVLIDELGNKYNANIMTLSGPSHAEEVSRQIPTTVTVAGPDDDNLRYVQEIFTSPYFRVYTHEDLIGVELAGSLKNIIAIAAGICDGLGFGDNTKGALLCRGLAEITRLGLKMGAQQETFAGLSGLGDLITTCLSKHSRNRYVGERLGLGKNIDEILAEMTMVAEGVNTTRAAIELARRYDVDMPITAEVNEILFHGKAPREAVNDLMTRELKPEVRL